MADERAGPFWDMVEGRRPAPPVAKLLGWTLREIDPERGTIKVEYTGRADFLNPGGTIQGGILSAMLDDAMGPAAAATLGGDKFAQTLEMKTSYMRPARPGPIFAEARVVHRGRQILFVEGTLRDGAGNLLATGSATFRAASL